MGIVQTVPEGIVVLGTVQPVPVTGPTMNSCAPFCALGTLMLPIALAAVNWTKMLCEAEVDPIAVAGTVVLVLTLRMTLLERSPM